MIKYEILAIIAIAIFAISFFIAYLLKIKKLRILYVFLGSWFIWLIFNFLFHYFFFTDYQIASMKNSEYKDILFTISVSFIIEPLHHFLALTSLIIILFHRIYNSKKSTFKIPR